MKNLKILEITAWIGLICGIFGVIGYGIEEYLFFLLAMVYVLLWKYRKFSLPSMPIFIWGVISIILNFVLLFEDIFAIFDIVLWLIIVYIVYQLEKKW